jgi:hypothetical protein
MARTETQASGNPAWWEAAISGTCSHGGHGWDGDTCSDAPTVQDAPHVMVTWANAISTRRGVSECFASRDDALAAAADRTREQWNNTRVTIAWHEAHDRAEARSARRAAHAGHRHTWGFTCKECAAVSADRAESAALVEAARDAAGDHQLYVAAS